MQRFHVEIPKKQNSSMHHEKEKGFHFINVVKKIKSWSLACVSYFKKVLHYINFFFAAVHLTENDFATFHLFIYFLLFCDIDFSITLTKNAFLSEFSFDILIWKYLIKLKKKGVSLYLKIIF